MVVPNAFLLGRHGNCKLPVPNGTDGGIDETRKQRQEMTREMMAPRDNVIWLTQQLPRASVSGKASTHENSTFHFHTSRADPQMRGFRFRLRAPCPQELSRKHAAGAAIAAAVPPLHVAHWLITQPLLLLLLSL